MHKDFVNETLDEETIDPNPIRQFQSWFGDAVAEDLPLPEAMTLATATKDGRSSARMVLLKQLDENPFAALVFYWPQLERQVRIEGTVSRVSAHESDEYFRSRPRDSQIGALASPQSEVIESRETLVRRFRELEEMYRDRSVERPQHWGGYLVKPERIEFWKGRPGRLHDRISYDLEPGGSWAIKRLAP